MIHGITIAPYARALPAALDSTGKVGGGIVNNYNSYIGVGNIALYGSDIGYSDGDENVPPTIDSNSQKGSPKDALISALKDDQSVILVSKITFKCINNDTVLVIHTVLNEICK